MITQQTYSLDATTPTTVVAPTVDAGHYVLKNIEPKSDIADYARQGYAYAVNRYFSIANNGDAYFSFTTGSTGAQFDFWVFSSSNSSVIASLIEGATITTTGSAIPGYNMNRNESDAHEAELLAATAITGGTVVYSNYVGASNQAAGGAQSNMIITLEPNTEYGFRFQDVGGNGTNLHVLIGWVELYNGYNDIWLGTPNESFVLRAGEEVKFKLFPQETINAIAGHTGAKLSVIRQD